MTRPHALLLTAALGASGCVTEVAAPPHDVSQSDWDHAREALARARARVPRTPYVEHLKMTFREPRTGRIVEGRGAVAVAPGEAMRLILLGPGGSTALDVWVTRDLWRCHVPALGLLRRGGENAPAGLPIAFFRAWFIAPFAGRLLTWSRGELVLRDRAATVRLSAGVAFGRGRLVRREGTSVEQLDLLDGGEANPKNAHIRYQSQGSGVEIDWFVEGRSSDAPDPEAFADPDAREPPP